MPGMSGIDVLKHATKLRPEAVGVLLTAYTDMPVLLEAINSGAVYRYVQKPWDSKELAVVLRQSIERFHTVRENRRLREQLARYAGYLETEQRNPMDFGELSTDLERFVHGHSPPREALRECAAFNQFHHESANTVGLFQAVDVCDIRMV